MKRFEPLVEEIWSDDSDEEAQRVADQGKEVTRIRKDEGILNPADLAVDIAGPACGSSSTVSVVNSKNVRFGPTIITVSQTDNSNNETVKVGCLCLDFKTARRSRRIRFSVALCVCWSIVIAATLAICGLILAPTFKTRLDIGLNETWYLRRKDWHSLDVNVSQYLSLPVDTVIITHTEASYCNEKKTCRRTVHEMQDRCLQARYQDVVPNFFVGGNGLVVEGRGANVVGRVMKGFDANAISVSFIGDYSTDIPDKAQFDHVSILLKTLVDEHVLVENYYLYGLCQLHTHVVAPGWKVMRRLDEFTHWNSSKANECNPGRF